MPGAAGPVGELLACECSGCVVGAAAASEHAAGPPAWHLIAEPVPVAGPSPGVVLGLWRGASAEMV